MIEKIKDELFYMLLGSIFWNPAINIIALIFHNVKTFRIIALVADALLVFLLLVVIGVTVVMQYKYGDYWEIKR